MITCRNWENGALSPMEAINFGAYFMMILLSSQGKGATLLEVEVLVTRAVTLTRPPVRTEISLPPTEKMFSR